MVLTDPMHGDFSSGVRQLLARMPQWLRADLSSSDAILRERAEDALAAMIAATLPEQEAAAVLPLLAADPSSVGASPAPPGSER